MTAPILAPVPTAAQLRPYSKEPEKLVDLLGVLAELSVGRATPAAYRKAGEWIAAHVPHEEVTERDRMRIPMWGITTWLDELWVDANECEDMNHDWPDYHFWCHRWGVVRVFGVTTLVTEPYFVGESIRELDDPAEVAAAPRLLREIGRRFSGVTAWSPLSAWGHGASRIMVFPHPSTFPEVFAPRLMRSYYRPDLVLNAKGIVTQLRGVPLEKWNRRPINPTVRLTSYP